MGYIFTRSIQQQQQTLLIQQRNNYRVWVAFSTTTTNQVFDEIDILQQKPPSSKSKEEHHLFFNIPKRLRQKVVGIDDAVSLISNNDTICASGFVAQGTPPIVPLTCSYVVLL